MRRTTQILAAASKGIKAHGSLQCGILRKWMGNGNETSHFVGWYNGAVLFSD
jgi:hypothetical protein